MRLLLLMPGDPLRAKYFAETLLEEVVCFNQVRGMLGFTGIHGSKRISVMGSGMGMPSLAIYVNELVREYGVKTIIRVGTCGSIQPFLNIGDIVLAMTASTDSQINKLRFRGQDFAPAASFDLLRKAYEYSCAHGIEVHVGGMFSGDSFYPDDPDWWRIWSDYGSLVVEMESNTLYTLAAKYKIDALSILTVSDSLVTGELATPEVREKGFLQMAEIALAIVP